MKEEEIKNKINKLDKLIEEIVKDSEGYKGSCPIQHDHYRLSQLLFGLGRYVWTCGFCGEEESE